MKKANLPHSSSCANFARDDQFRAQQLKQRLYEHGLNPKPLPSVRRPKPKMPLQQRFPEGEVSTKDLAWTRSTPMLVFSSNPSSAGSRKVLRPSTMSKTSFRPITARSGVTLSRVTSARPQTKEGAMAFNLMDRMTGRVRTGRPPTAYQVRPKVEAAARETRATAPLSKLDEFIHKVQQMDYSSNEFLYLQGPAENYGYDMEVVDPADVQFEKYYTISAKGLSTFVKGAPIEFTKLNEWLIERDVFRQLKEVPFFRKFRVWKTVSMWTKNVAHIRREKKKKDLQDKLYLTKKVYADLLLNHRQTCLEVEKIKIVEVPSFMQGYGLEEFVSYQHERSESARRLLEKYAARLRENIVFNIRQIMDKLREDIVMDIAAEKNYGKVNLQAFPMARKVCALYEKLGFPENMSYGQRAVLRRECTRFIRFSYLADFIVLESLRLLYVANVREILHKVYEQCLRDLSLPPPEEDPFYSNVDTKKRVRNTLLKGELVLYPYPPEMVQAKPYEDFFPNVHDAETFHPNMHLSADVPATVTFVSDLEEQWLRFVPSQEEVTSCLTDLIDNCFDLLSLVDRWSRHPEMDDFVAALEDWDDKVSDHWKHAESLALDIKPWVADEFCFTSAKDALDEALSAVYEKATSEFSNFTYALQAHYKNEEVNFERLRSPALVDTLNALKYTFDMFEAQRKRLEKTTKVIEVGLLKVDASSIRQQVLAKNADCLNQTKDLLLHVMRRELQKHKQWIQTAHNETVWRASNIDEFVQQRISYLRIKEEISEVKLGLDNLNGVYRLGVQKDVEFMSTDHSLYASTVQSMSSLTSQLILLESTNEKNMVIYKKDLKLLVPDLQEDIHTIIIKVEEDRFVSLDENFEDMITELKEFSEKAQELKERARKINLYQKTLDEPTTVISQVDEATEKVDVRLKVWEGLQEFVSMRHVWLRTSVRHLEHRELSRQCDRYMKILRMGESVLPPCSLTAELRRLIVSMQKTLPVIQTFKSPLQESHWATMSNLLGGEELSLDLQLNTLVDMRALDFQEEIKNIGYQAVQEASLKAQLASIVGVWDEMELPIKHVEKDVVILGDIEELLGTLDDSLAKLSMIDSNQYSGPLREEVGQWKDNLNTIVEVLEEWTRLQKAWLYLKSIFSAPDIKRKMSSEYQMFGNVNKFYKGCMAKAHATTSIVRFCIENRLLEQFRKHNNTVDVIQRNLSNYIEDKRRAFPRFYFISDEELLQILAGAAHPASVVPQLRKCFEDIGLEFAGNDVLAMISAEGERLELNERNVKARPNVEEWLNNLQGAMCDKVQKTLREARNDFARGPRAWLLGESPAQSLLAVAQVVWSAETEFSLSLVPENADALSDALNSTVELLRSYVGLIREPLPPLKRSVLVGLITGQVHNRDVVRVLLEDGVGSPLDFAWMQQLRFYLVDDGLLLKQVTAVIPYGNEYLGVPGRLVITPLTERCWITVTAALHIHLGAAPVGPAGTGKTESVKDLAKAAGMLCVVFNCSEQITHAMMGRLFAGLAQQGAWSCLDEFNRIDAEVLSVVAQQLLAIHQALRGRETEFNFEGRQMPLRNCGVFVTMNPGYAGRVELPDNLKVLFRPIAMMIPDYSLIAEVVLLAEGFASGPTLSSKVVQLYKLASEQLSQQPHYDFGMRALKSVLLIAGALKRASPELEEIRLIIQAMKEANLPKLMPDDTRLFNGLIGDLFPGISAPPAEFGPLSDHLTAAFESENCQFVKASYEKALELHQTLQVRVGVILLGESFTGKSTVPRLLASALNRQQPQSCTCTTLNPKAISIGELFGEFNELTQDWRDGLASYLIRRAALSKEQSAAWVLFDGPVDPLWIESMNTVLDDNRMLCLPNGERIRLRPDTRLLFEVLDLQQASPATVSRCGVLHLDTHCVTWKEVVRSWLATQSDPELRGVLEELFNQCMGSIAKQFSALQHQIDQPFIQRVRCLCNLLEVMLRAPTIEKSVKKVAPKFAFALMWGLGSSLLPSSYERFSNILRYLFSQVAPLPIAGTLFDFYLDEDGMFKTWEDLVPPFTYDESLSFSQLVVPTPHTIKYEYLLDLLLSSESSILLMGETGVGKSCVIKHFISRNKEAGLVEAASINCSARTTSNYAQLAIEAKLERKNVGLFSAPGTKKLVVFVDDVNMPAADFYGSQPPLELLRQFAEQRGFYDRKKLLWKAVSGFSLLCSAVPSSSRPPLPPRLLGHMHGFFMPEPSQGTLLRIFTAILGGFLDNGFTDALKKHVEPCVKASIALYYKVVRKLKPTPAKFHYVYNIRDLAKVIQGLLMTCPSAIENLKDFTKLWMHETCRVFQDRLVNTEDRNWFFSQTLELCSQHFNISYSEDMFRDEPLLFTNLMNLDRQIVSYERIVNKQKLMKFLNLQSQEFNAALNREGAFAFFDEAVQHTLRIARTLYQSRGSLLLIGVSGSGKQSLVRLVSNILGYHEYRIAVSKIYGLENFREDLKQMLAIAGVEGRHVSFMLTDTQIVNEGFLEDINSLLNTGEISDLYTEEEMDVIIDAVRPHFVDKLKVTDQKEGLFKAFLTRASTHLHMILCMSPIGHALRQRCRAFPSLVNCCALDWYDRWPREALLAVAEHYSSGLGSGLSELCAHIHSSLYEASESLFFNFKRRTYVTPKSYLDFLALFQRELDRKRSELGNKRETLDNGLSKLKSTRELVNELQIKLTQMAPSLDKEKLKAEEYHSEVREQTAAAEAMQLSVESETTFIELQAEECRQHAQAAEKDLEQAIPALNAAIEAVQALDKNRKDIIEFKSYQKPPEAVRIVVEAVLVLLGERTDWSNALHVLGQMDFVQRLLNFDKEGITPGAMRKLKQYINRADFKPEVVAKSSEATRSLCMWVIAVHKYGEIFQLVKPKKEKVEVMKQKLQNDVQKLEQKRAELEAVDANVKRLKYECQTAEENVSKLENEIKQTEIRLKRAKILIELLADERIRWAATLQNVEKEMNSVEADMLLTAASLNYLGPFTEDFRKQLTENWLAKASRLKLVVSDNFSLVHSLEDPKVIRDWQISGLPSDIVSTENAVIAKHSPRHPLLIDPQTQAGPWIKKANLHLEEPVILKANSKPDLRQLNELIRNFEIAIFNGKLVIIENVGETLDSYLEPLLAERFTVTEDGRVMIKISEKEITFNPNFRLFLITTLHNPHYLPEVCTKVNLINFSVTFPGLQEQLLTDVVKLLQPELEKQRDTIVLAMSEDQKLLEQTQQDILELMAKTEGNVLDNTALISALERSKRTSGALEQRVKTNIDVQFQINESRNTYLPVSTRGSLLYFIVKMLSELDPMYQFSLTYIKKLYSSAIDEVKTANSDQSSNLKDLEVFLDNITQAIYRNVCRGLFETHKTLFSFFICITLQRHAKQVSEEVWELFIRGPGILDKRSKKKNTLSDYISSSRWDLLCAMDITLPTFSGLITHIANNHGAWTYYLTTADPLQESLPFSQELSDLEQLLLIQAVRPDKLIVCVYNYVQKHLGEAYTRAASTSFDTVLADSHKGTPIVFILSPGMDPTENILKHARAQGYLDKTILVSLGQGQGPKATAAMERGRNSGSWVVLQNCHLASSWMPTLANFVEGLDDASTNTQFRLFLTSMPSANFPATVLQNSLKLTTEPPKGIKANLSLIYSQHALHGKGETWKNLVFALSFFHALVTERRRFGAIGFNVQHQFNESDFESSLKMLQLLVEENEEVPWEALHYITGQINYGGRVTDDWDRLCLMATLRKCYHPDALEDYYRFSELDEYYVPPAQSLEDVQAYIGSLPNLDSPEVFGLHANASIAYQSAQGSALIQHIRMIEPKHAGEQMANTDEVVGQLCKTLLITLPEDIETNPSHSELFTTSGSGLIPCLSTFLLHEVDRFNLLLGEMRSSLKTLRAALKGKVLMSDSLEDMYTALHSSAVPLNWKKVAYDSLKPLSSWVNDLNLRIKHVKDWIKYGNPGVYWISGFFFPQSFITAVLQTHARRYSLPIDSLNFKFKVLKDENSKSPSPDGVLVNGMFLEGARWDKDENFLAEALPGELFYSMPPIHFLPVQEGQNKEYEYMCPVYKTTTRAGILSSTGQSQNYVLSISLPIDDDDPDHWTLRGVALVCQLND